MRYFSAPVVVGSVLCLAGAVVLASANSAAAAQPPVGLGVATSFVVLAGSTVTNTGPSVLNGDLGLSPGSAIPGVNSLPGPATVNGNQHITDGVAAQAQLNLTTAYNDAAGRTPQTPVGADLTGATLAPGIYTSPTLGLTGTVTLNGHNNPAAVFIFKAASTLITSSNSTVALIGVNPCNVYWQVGSSATLGTNSNFVGTVVALTSISATTGATISGRLLARNGAVTLDDNTITRPSCALVNPTPTPTPTTPTPTKTKPGGGGSSTPGGGGGSSSHPGGGGSSSHPGGGGSSHPNGGPSTPRTHSPGVPLHSPPNSTTPPQGTPPSASTPGQPPTLARTGSDNANLTVGGALAIILGGLLLLIGRRTSFRGPREH